MNRDKEPKKAQITLNSDSQAKSSFKNDQNVEAEKKVTPF